MTKELYVPTVNRCPDNDLSFGVPQIVAASEQAQRDPANLTDRQLEIIASYAYADAQDFARQRAEARAKAAAPPPVPAAAVASAKPARSGPRVPRLEDGCFSTPERMEAWASANAMCFVPVLMWERFLAKDRSKREDLEAEVRRLEALVVLQDRRIQHLETNGAARGLSWAGDHEHGRAYRAGEFCKRVGSVWVATRDTSEAPGMSPTDWELVFKGQTRP